MTSINSRTIIVFMSISIIGGGGGYQSPGNIVKFPLYFVGVRSP